MPRLRIAAAVLNQTPLDWAGNLDNCLAAVADARRVGATLLCLPELCLSGYGCEDAFHGSWVHEAAWGSLRKLAAATRGLVVVAGLPLAHQRAIFNVAAVLVDGRVAGFVAKQHLAGDGIHYEPRWFKPWPAGLRQTVTRDGETYPIGDLVFDVGGVRLGFEICEDAWVATRPGASLARRAVDVLLNPSASHFAFGKIETRRRFVLEGSRAFGAAYVYANLLGNEAGRAIYDGGALIAAEGRMLAEGPRLSFLACAVTFADVDLARIRLAMARVGSHQPDLRAAAEGTVELPFAWPKTTPRTNDAAPPQPTSPADWTATEGEELKAEEFTRAVALALFDYLRKSRAGGFVVSLSGGADSAAVTALVALLVRFAVAELGADAFRARLAHLPTLARAGDTDGLVRRLLTCVYQGTANSGPVTRAAARDVAEALGAEFFEFEVGGLVDAYRETVETAIGRPLTWEGDDLALQNIQARVRAPGVWLLANLRGALLLATSNRSEAAVGYATMDGDTCGGLSPIAGIDKAYLRRWLVWLETRGPRGIGPLPALRTVNVQAPTAELRPAAKKQTDETDLMPYDVLDACERAAIRDKCSPAETLETLRAAFPQHAASDLLAWVKRFFRLWSRNQWKRERYAPSFHLDDENLDPKTWCRWPILSGGFEAELAALDES